MKKFKDRSGEIENKVNVYIAFALIVFVVITIVIFKTVIKTQDDAQNRIGINEEAVNEVVAEAIIDNNAEVLEMQEVNETKQQDNTDKSIKFSRSAITPEQYTTDEADAVVTENNTEVKLNQLTPYEIIAAELELLKSKDIKTVISYFGKSEIFTPETVADKISATNTSFMGSEEIEDKTKVIIHVCTLDYDKLNDTSLKMKEKLQEVDDGEVDTDGIIKTEIAKGVINKQFDIHYNIELYIKDGSIELTEEFKQAITGNWYHGINVKMESIECPLET